MEKRLRRTEKRDLIWAELVAAAAGGKKSVRFDSPDTSTLEFLSVLGLNPKRISKRGEHDQSLVAELEILGKRYSDLERNYENRLDKAFNRKRSHSIDDFASSVQKEMSEELVSWLVMHCSTPYTDVFGRYFMRDFSYRGGHSIEELREIQELALKEQRITTDSTVRAGIRDLVARIDRVLDQSRIRYDEILKCKKALEEIECERTALRKHITSQGVSVRNAYEVSLEGIVLNSFDDEYDLRWIQWLAGSEGQKFLTKIEHQLKKSASQGDAFEIFEVSERPGYPSTTKANSPWKPYAYFCDGEELISQGAEPKYFCYIMGLLGYGASLRLKKNTHVVSVKWS